ncbi:ABC transporter ATP-binding protein [Desulfurivibrio alkaliphilus]|uniref:Nickel import system ATP-binding protein NikD n=1 Tax=Desulfurivibrio alkaliphilus (strain DSM 19089 / UNIQEM U267 / AHT2) TaxID=589865 RepID=D6Z3Z1_DESAT|nr:ATP-binding cassette domain-containing protein [Desulfurivibrio alkaliphilus]ADH86266.1 ABC transporter related protein [Desulfurivibrio alkaliphilus AHT 2]
MSLTIRKLSVTYRDADHRLTALERLNLELAPGTITALVGESGAGKSTLALALLGLLPAAAEVSGSMALAGQQLAGLDEAGWNRVRWQQIALVPQNGGASLNPVQRLLAQVAEPLQVHRGLGRREARAAAVAALERVGLPAALGERFPHQVSGGELQRVLLAMATIMAPPYLVLDEPTAALDPEAKALVGAQLRQAAEQGTTLLLITHDLELARQLADQVAVLYLGQLLELMPGKALLREPHHPYTLALGRAFPGWESHRDLGGIKGDALYRMAHRHPVAVEQPRDHLPGNGGENDHDHDHDHVHLVGSASHHSGHHLPARGCLFQPRCTQAVAACAAREMELSRVGEHWIRCLRGGIATQLEFCGAAKRYGSVTALAPVELTLRAGETFCLLGPSGSGKSTLAQLAAGLLSPDEGQVLFQGRELRQWQRRDRLGLARRIGLVQQHPARAVSHRLTVEEIVAEPLRIQQPELSAGQRRRRVAAALREVSLPAEENFLARYPHELNLGALQRVCIARALIGDPVLLVADEPTSALDPSVQAKVLKLLLHLQTERGLTLLFITHDLGLARKIADRIGVLAAGELMEQGPAPAILRRLGLRP